MNIVAFVLSLLSALISFLQGGCGTLLSSIGGSLSERTGDYQASRGFALLAGSGLLVMIASILGIIGGSLALGRKKSGGILLFICAGICGLAAAGGFKDAAIYAVLYVIAAFCGIAGSKSKTETQNSSPQSQQSYSSSSSDDRYNDSTLLRFLDKANSSTTPQTPQTTSLQKSYEPIIGLETESLIKRAFLFLEDGQFDDAGRYLEQALNQDAEDPRVHFGQLMLVHKVHSVEEFLENLDTPLENEKLFQRAMRFAQGEYKSQLEFYARANQKKLEQKRLAEEVERERQRIEAERKRAEQEAENERRYQEMLALRAKASSINELGELLLLLDRLKPYKDTNQISVEVSDLYTRECKYQEANRELQNASGMINLQNIISELEKLGEYKDSKKLLEEAKSKLEALEIRTRKTRREVIAVFVLVVAPLFGWQWYLNNQAKEAKTARENAMIAFFEGRNDEAFEAINVLTASADNPVFLNILAFIDYDKSGSNYEQLRKDAEHIIRDSELTSKKLFEEALDISYKYLSQPSANKFQGDLYLHGWGVEKNESRAVERFKVAAESGDVYSKSIIQKLANEGNPEAIYYEIRNTDYLQEQREKSFAELENTDVVAVYKKYCRSEVTPPNEDTSTSSAMVREWYEWGCDFLDSKSYPDALKYFRLAANENYAPAQDKLGWMYQNGWGVNRNYSEAYNLYKKAADQGNKEAQASLGYLYYRGLGVRKDLRQALYWYGKSAEQGNATAKRQYERIESELADQSSTPSQSYSQNDFPVSAFITGNKVNVRREPNIYADSVKQLNSGHPVSVSRKSTENDGDWFYVKTASGTEGWVRGDYVALNTNAERTQQERYNRKKTLPARGVISTIRIGNRTGNKLNLRAIPSTARTAQVITEVTTGDEFTALERFAEEERDWYHIRTDNYGEGWVSGRFIELR